MNIRLEYTNVKSKALELERKWSQIMFEVRPLVIKQSSNDANGRPLPGFEMMLKTEQQMKAHYSDFKKELHTCLVTFNQLSRDAKTSVENKPGITDTENYLLNDTRIILDKIKKEFEKEMSLNKDTRKMVTPGMIALSRINQATMFAGQPGLAHGLKDMRELTLASKEGGNLTSELDELGNKMKSL